MRIWIENALAVIGLLALIGAAAIGVLHLYPKERIRHADPRLVAIAPVQYDATVCQRGAGEKFKCRGYLRKENR